MQVNRRLLLVASLCAYLVVMVSCNSVRHRISWRLPETIRRGDDVLPEDTNKCPPVLPRNASAACLDICEDVYRCIYPAICCPNACGTRSCVLPKPKDTNNCDDIECTQQGSVCKVDNGVAKCECVKGCSLNADERLCASNNVTYINRCEMDKAACKMNTTVEVVSCVTVVPSTLLVTNEPYLAPRAMSFPHPRTVFEGTNVTFRCLETMSGHPTPDIFWKAKNHAGFLRPGQRFERYSSDLESTDFRIVHVRLSDAGIYKCQGVNIVGSATLTYRLNVQSVSSTRRSNQSAFDYTKKCLQPSVQQARNCLEPSGARFYRRYWTFNRYTEQCESLAFLDCSSIINKYVSKQLCQSTCKNPCMMPKQQGNCRNFTQRVFYNSKNGRCEPYVSSGCGRSKNDFPDIDSCKNSCPVKGVRKNCRRCSTNVAAGYCAASFVIQGRILSIYDQGRERDVKMRITRVFKDSEIGLHYLNLSDPAEAVMTFSLHTGGKCSCPDLQELREEHIRPERTDFVLNCEESDFNGVGHRRKHIDRRCVEVIVSGTMRFGMPVINEGSLGLIALTRHVERLKKTATNPNVCEVLNMLIRHQSNL